jgi:hypothetical protein
LSKVNKIKMRMRSRPATNSFPSTKTGSARREGRLGQIARPSSLVGTSADDRRDVHGLAIVVDAYGALS